MERKFLSEKPNYEKYRHLGSNGDIKLYAERFLELRVWQINKDIEICLRGLRNPKKPTTYMHAYFPSVLICCGTFELLANLYGGSLDPGHKGAKRRARLYGYCKMMPHSCYTKDNIRALYSSLRNKLAHHSTGGGAWIDKNAQPIRKVIWRIDASNHHPALSIIPKNGMITRHPPHDCEYTHILDIRLDRFRCDIIDSIYQTGGYKDQLLSNLDLQGKFQQVIDGIYPK